MTLPMRTLARAIEELCAKRPLLAAEIRRRYRLLSELGMGAAPGALELPELANPEAGQRIRAEFAERFAAIGQEHAGTVAGTIAHLEAIELGASPYDPVVQVTELESLLAKAERLADSKRARGWVPFMPTGITTQTVRIGNGISMTGLPNFPWI